MRSTKQRVTFNVIHIRKYIRIPGMAIKVQTQRNIIHSIKSKGENRERKKE